MLKILASPDGKLDAKALLNSAKTLQTHLNRLDKLGEIHCNMDEAVLSAFASEVESLSNMELLDIYRQFGSSDMAHLKRALQHEVGMNPKNEDAKAASANLALLEALVTLEAGNRIIAAEGLAKPDEIKSIAQKYGSGIEGMRQVRREASPTDMDAVNMHVLINVDRESSLRSKDAEKIASDTLQHCNIGNGKADKIGAKQFGDVLRSAGLTMNMDLGFLFGMQGSNPLLKASGAWEHLFRSVESASNEEERQAAIDVKGAGYLISATKWNVLFSPSLAKTVPLLPKSVRPMRHWPYF